MIDQRQPYWFHAKRYGWGWGLPSRWEGWFVLITWVILLVPLSHFLAGHNLPLFFVFILAMSAALIAIAYVKGDPRGRRWRWGS